MHMRGERACPLVSSYPLTARQRNGEDGCMVLRAALDLLSDQRPEAERLWSAEEDLAARRCR